jgi:hypothetical protein
MKIYLAGLYILWALISCQKEAINSNDATINPITSSGTFNATNQNLLLQGSFENAMHSTSGTVKVYEDKDKKRTLVLENFKTDAGPDLRIYLAEDKSVTNFIQITDKLQNGNISLEIPSDVDLKKQNHVLIWCRKYAVLFGFAQLK